MNLKGIKNNKIIKFIHSSLSSSIVDFIIYSLLVKTIFNPDKLTSGILLSTIIARIFSCLYNYFYNKKRVFKSDSNIESSLLKYTLFAIAQMFASSLLVSSLYYLTRIDSIIIKCFVDSLLFFVSYFAQKYWIFK